MILLKIQCFTNDGVIYQFWQWWLECNFSTFFFRFIKSWIKLNIKGRLLYYYKWISLKWNQIILIPYHLDLKVEKPLCITENNFLNYIWMANTVHIGVVFMLLEMGEMVLHIDVYIIKKIHVIKCHISCKNLFLENSGRPTNTIELRINMFEWTYAQCTITMACPIYILQ